MKLAVWQRMFAALVVASLLVAAGCSDSDKDKGTGGTTDLTPEEQLELIDMFLGGDSDSGIAGAFDALSLALEFQAGIAQWGGFDCNDFNFEDIPLAKLAVPGDVRISSHMRGLAKRGTVSGVSTQRVFGRALQIASTKDDPVCQYDEGDERWELDLNQVLSADMDTLGSYLIDVDLTLYVQYLDGQGNGQESPDLTTTAFSQDFDVSVHVEFDLPGDAEDLALVLDADATSSSDLTGLNTALVTMSGETELLTDIDLNYEIQVPDGQGGFQSSSLSLDGGLNFDIMTNSIQFDVSQGLESSCPIGGAMTANMDVDMLVEVDDQREAIDSDWGMSVDFNSNGEADLEIHSVDFPSVGRDTTITTCGDES